ncbi:YraN family protein [Falsirhodobacter xinxiangensis]|uniref:YraN family protein n=1 Tax=Falsirhodobacter xinxiangensis TaxID=2530049 RepID=UPI0010AAE5C6|nr:YraN family protein [Rhodobacter xinxiangensis]
MSLVNHHAGLAAEDIVARHYALPVAAKRWKGPGGEVDLILRDGATVIFVEVKKSRSHAAAALRLTPRQIARIHASASAFLGGEPAGQRTDCRFDVALVDGTGRVEVIANVLGP